jgi:putative inorganic carbon (HCO3(-)) transporter
MSAHVPERTALAPRVARPAFSAAPRVVAKEKVRQNWVLYVFLFFLPLQNLQTGYMPNLGGGINFLNIGFGLSLLGAFYCKGTLTRWSSVHSWVLAYVAYACLSLFIGYTNVSDTDDHFNILKDSMLAVMLVFVVEMSVTDWTSMKRAIIAMLLPLPYILKVTWSEHDSVSSWHYSDALRISGTFSLLGANEYAAFCVMMAIVMFGLLLAGGLSRGWKAGLIVGITCVVIGVAWAYSRTAYVALMLGLVAVLLLWRGRWKMIVPLFLFALALPAILPTSVVERFDSTTIEEGKRDESTEMRFEFWSLAIDNFENHPLFGSGFQTFRHHEINPFNMDTHNFFMRELTEKGIVGILITLGMLIAILRACWRTMRESASGTLAYALGLGMVGAWLALVLGNCFGDRFTYYPMIGYFWVFLGLTLKARDLAYVESIEPKIETPTAPVRRFAQPRGSA